MADLDEEINQCYAEGYLSDVDRLLEERRAWQRERDQLFASLSS